MHVKHCCNCKHHYDVTSDLRSTLTGDSDELDLRVGQHVSVGSTGERSVRRGGVVRRRGSAGGGAAGRAALVARVGAAQRSPEMLLDRRIVAI